MAVATLESGRQSALVEMEQRPSSKLTLPRPSEGISSRVLK